jgi:4-alpha-glucanotransferase
MELERLAAAGRALNRERRIDRDAIFGLKMRALERLWVRFGVDPNGADAWAWQNVLATGVTVGAPPDEYKTRGQDWGLPSFIPHKLRAAAYEPFRQTMRATLRHAGGLRIDHVMGLFRLYWIPQGADPSMGAYVRYPADELLAIVALESQRARALVVGEDLGTVEEGVQERLAAHRLLSYRLL